VPTLTLLIYCLLYFSASQHAQAQIETPAQLLHSVQASLVDVHTVDTKTFTKKNGHSTIGTYNTDGSGVIIDSHGIIVTNSHIVIHAPHIYVGLPDGTKLEARIVYSSDADFSFLKVDPPYPLTPITWADSSTAQVGTPIMALSNADDTHQHILGGEITNLINGVSTNNVEAFEINLTLYHGDSGGPLLDNQGHLLGLIMGKKLSDNANSYAIASNKIQQEYQQYQQKP